jgi:hypothetical protein
MCITLGDKPEELRRAREMYIEGMPPWIVAHFFGVPKGELRQHAWGHNWCRRRTYNLPDREYLLTMLLLARARDSWHLVAGNSANNALALLMKLAERRE